MSMDTITAVADHPAKYSVPVLTQIQQVLDMEDRRAMRPLRVMDSFAGTGLVHSLATAHGLHTWGVELEPEWAACEERTIVGNALALPFPAGCMDGWLSSVCYGNRMADSHQAQDGCKTCDGRGWVLELDRVCPTCKGYKMSRRNTYTHRLQAATGDPTRKLHTDNAGTLRWGKGYRQFHERAYREALRCIRPGGFVIVNISNHLETSRGVTVEHRVSEWTMNAWLMLGLHLIGSWPIETRRNGQGANRDTRCEFEHVMAFRVPTTFIPQLS